MQEFRKKIVKWTLTNFLPKTRLVFWRIIDRKKMARKFVKIPPTAKVARNTQEFSKKKKIKVDVSNRLEVDLELVSKCMNNAKIKM